MSTIDLAGDLAWMEVTIPGSDRPVRLHRLHADPHTGATLSVVRFPPGWRRPGTGHYECAEEFTVLDGSITVGGVVHQAGDHVYLPPRAVRAGSVSDHGCLALAFFGAPPRWVEGEPQVPADHAGRSGPPEGLMREPRPGVQGGSELTGALSARILGEDVDLLSMSTGRWARVPAGAPVPELEPPILVRRWTVAR